MINFDIIILNKMNNSELKLYILNKIEEINDNSEKINFSIIDNGLGFGMFANKPAPFL